MEQALMQMPNSQRADRVGNENFDETVDFPTKEELWAALETSLEQPSWLARPAPVALDATTRNLAQRWQEIAQDSKEVIPRNSDEHYLSSWATDQALNTGLAVEPDLLIDLIKFLLGRLAGRLQEVRQAQHQLTAELAKLRS